MINLSLEDIQSVKSTEVINGEKLIVYRIDKLEDKGVNLKTSHILLEYY